MVARLALVLLLQRDVRFEVLHQRFAEAEPLAVYLAGYAVGHAAKVRPLPLLGHELSSALSKTTSTTTCKLRSPLARAARAPRTGCASPGMTYTFGFGFTALSSAMCTAAALRHTRQP